MQTFSFKRILYLYLKKNDSKKLFAYWIQFLPSVQRPLAWSMVTASHWLRSIESYTFLWPLMPVSANRNLSNSGQDGKDGIEYYWSLKKLANVFKFRHDQPIHKIPQILKLINFPTKNQYRYSLFGPQEMSLFFNQVPRFVFQPVRTYHQQNNCNKTTYLTMK